MAASLEDSAYIPSALKMGKECRERNVHGGVGEGLDMAHLIPGGLMRMIQESAPDARTNQKVWEKQVANAHILP